MNGNSRADDRAERRRTRREWREQMRNGPTSLACAIRGPITLITVGGLFALSNFTQYGIDKTWPVFLIVFGLLTLVCRGTRQVPQQQGNYPPAAPPYNYPPQGGYPQPPTGAGAAAETQTAAKGGFGTSAPPRAGDSGQTPSGGGAA